ncbi:hypothetical protein AB0H73_09905 [Streptomyces olivoreticuli]
MTTTTLWPPRTSDRSALLHAYADVLAWPLIVSTRLVTADQAEQQLAGDPATAVFTTCAAVDAVTVAHDAGMTALVRLERRGIGPVPCFAAGHRTLTFLVRAGSGQDLGGLDGASIATGTGWRVEIPPSPGVRWDTPPWSCTEREALMLCPASDLRRDISEALHFHRNAPR